MKRKHGGLASINEEVNNTLKNCDQLHILTGNECNTFIEGVRSNNKTFNMAEYAIICCHHTFVEKIEEQLKEICRKNSIPLIFFSGRYSYSYMSDNVLQLSVDKFYTQALPCIVQDIKAENPLILEKIEFGEDYEVAILMNTRNKLIEWLESEDDTRTYSELDLDSYVLELADNASLTECVHEDKEYNPTLLREQINSISSLIKQKI
jgi:histidinol phosphatase-like PHP family hydrolase